jgi:hypothetical protein
MTVQVIDTHVHVQRLVSVVKMVTVLKEYILAMSSVPLCVLLWASGLNEKDIHREIFPCLRWEVFVA